MLLLAFGIPVILVIGAIFFSFDSRIALYEKIFCFLLLPIVEIIISFIALLQAKPTNMYFEESGSLYLRYFLISSGIIGTLIVSLVSELSSAVKLAIRFTSLAVFGSILTWSFLNIK